MTLSSIHWVPVQDKGSKILCVKLGAMKVTQSDPLHQEYLTINLGSTSDWWQLKLPLVRLFGTWRGRCWPGGAVWGRECRRKSSVLPLNLSDTAATSQDGSSLEFINPQRVLFILRYFLCADPSLIIFPALFCSRGGTDYTAEHFTTYCLLCTSTVLH